MYTYIYFSLGWPSRCCISSSGNVYGRHLPCSCMLSLFSNIHSHSEALI